MDGGSWFNEGACPMTITTHRVVVPFPQAFASPQKKRSPFPSAPRYGPTSPHQADRPPTVRWECALRRGSTLSICQVAHAQVDTLVLLPTGTFSRGTQRNTLDLSHVQTVSRPILAQGLKSGNQGCPCTFLFIPGMNDQG